MIGKDIHKFAQELWPIKRNKKYKVTVLCEPNLSKRGFYTKRNDENAWLVINLTSLCDGESTLLEIAESLEVPIWSLYDCVIKLVDEKLIYAIE